MSAYEQHCTEIVTQSELLAAGIAGRDMTLPVPSCPGWNVGQLVRHLGGAQRWIEGVVRERATGSLGVVAGAQRPPQDQPFRDLTPYTHEDADVVGKWLVDGAHQLADALREAGPDATVWTPVPRGAPTPVFHARRMTHETAVHRADAFLALDVNYELAVDVARDAVDEWLELAAIPEALANPATRELLGPGRTVALQATDAADAAWLIDLTGEAIGWRRSGEAAAVTVRGPLTELVLLVYRRRADVEVNGDRGLFEFWHERIAFG